MRHAMFFYGMLLDPEQASMSTSDLVGPARIEGRTLALGTYADAPACREGTVHGAVWNVSDRMLERLDDIEGEGTLYHRVRDVAILADGSPVQCQLYEMTSRTREYTEDRPPTDHYVKMIRRGYEQFDLPISALEEALSQ